MNTSQSIYHITHLKNLPSILASGGLYSDSKMRSDETPHTRIGHEHIKQRRLSRKVAVAAKGFLGDYVPFNFCSRSVMLYVINVGAVEGYEEGQDDVIHLVSTIELATNVGKPWAFTDRHADLGYARYFQRLSDLKEVDWDVMPKRQWGGDGNDDIKEKRQAEFLVHQFFPWSAVAQIGVKSSTIAQLVKKLIRSTDHQPDVLIQPTWYY